MRALVCEGPGVAALHDVDTPEPGPADVLVRVTTALTCGTDAKIFERGHPRIPFPVTLGHEFAGVVERAAASTGFHPGERVTCAVTAPCGACTSCESGRENLCETAFERPLFGAFADFLLVPERLAKKGMRKIPAGLSDDAAALLDPLASAIHGLNRVRAAAEGDVLIVGTGPIAAMLFFLLRRKERTGGAGRRIAVAGRRAQKLAFFERNEAETARIGESPKATANGAPSRPVFTFKEGSRSFSLVIDTTGDSEIIASLPARAADGGTVLLFAGLPRGAAIALDAEAIHYREVSIVGSFHYTPLEANEALALLAEGALPVDEIVSAHRPLAEWRAAFDLAKRGDALKVALVP